MEVFRLPVLVRLHHLLLRFPFPIALTYQFWLAFVICVSETCCRWTFGIQKIEWIFSFYFIAKQSKCKVASTSGTVTAISNCIDVKTGDGQPFFVVAECINELHTQFSRSVAEACASFTLGPSATFPVSRDDIAAIYKCTCLNSEYARTVFWWILSMQRIKRA